MILSHIVSNTQKRYTQKLNQSIKVLKNFNNRLQLKKKRLSLNYASSLKLNKNLVMYIINVILSATSTVVNVVDLKGRVLISISAGSLNLTKFQKRTQPMALLNIFKVLLLRAKFLKSSIPSDK